MLKTIMLVGTGGFLGSVLRYGISQYALRFFGTGFPAGTLIANVLGCLLAGLFFGLYEKEILSQHWRLLLTTGFCGGFTTFSAFAHESAGFLRSGNMSYFFIYLFLSLFLGLACMYAGLLLGKSLF
ncbi:MAG: fluoride efflux transporter FluC [Cytophagaceae bacterium]